MDEQRRCNTIDDTLLAHNRKFVKVSGYIFYAQLVELLMIISQIVF